MLLYELHSEFGDVSILGQKPCWYRRRNALVIRLCCLLRHGFAVVTRDILIHQGRLLLTRYWGTVLYDSCGGPEFKQRTLAAAPVNRHPKMYSPCSTSV